MRNICILFLVCLLSDCFADFIDNMLSKALTVKTLMQDDSESYSTKIVRRKTNQGGQSGYISRIPYTNRKKMTNSLRSVRRIPMLKRKDIFPKERIKSIDISPDGQRIACLVEEGKNRYIKFVPSQNQNLMSQTIKESYPIDNFSFIGKNLLYTYLDEENNLKVKVWVSLTQRKQLNLPENLKSIRLFKNDRACLAECYDGDKYSLYKINLTDFSCAEIKELSEPIRSLFDKDLKPFLIVKHEDNVVNIYIDSKKEGGNAGEEDEVDMGLDDRIQVDQIENPDLSRYFSVDNEKNCYKISIQKPQNLLIIDRVNPLKETKQEFYKLKGVSSLSQCKVNVEPDGKPSFVTVNSRRYQHYGCNSEMKTHIKVISNNFSSWYRINTTRDGKIWLICVVNDRALDKFCLYDTRTHNLKAISNLNNSANKGNTNNSYLKNMECYFLPLSGGEFIQMFLTRGVNSTSRSPLILMMNSSGQYKWEYMPVVQVLANRGYNVLCLNYRKDDLSADSIEDFENSVTKATSDIAEAINWSVKNGVAQLGNIVLLAKKHSVIPAMQMFLKNQGNFAGYIAVNPSENDINLINSFNLEKILKPTMFIGRFNNSEAVPTLTEKISADTLSIISSNDLINQKLMTGIVEVFLAKKFNNPMVENIAKAEVNSLDIKHDGLNILETSDNSHIYDADDKREEDLAEQYKSL